MAHEEKLGEYSEQKLAGREIPADLRALLLVQWQRAEGNSGPDPLDAIEAYLFDVGETDALLDHSYLNDKDRADPDIMANVAAMDSVCEHAVFVARDFDGNVFGYWFGPQNVPIADAAIVKLDTEGQFSLPAGRTLSEALLGDRLSSGDDERFAQLKQEFANAGIEIDGDTCDDLEYPQAETDPGVLHEEKYNENRTKAGLPPYL